jgi:hypothetical protein
MNPAGNLFIVDGHALAYRAYFAFIRNPLVNSKGENTGAVFGFLRMLLLLIRKYEPRYLAVVFDSGEETERHREFPAYKAHRPEMPDEMAEQLPLIFEATEALGIHTIVEPGIEQAADGVIDDVVHGLRFVVERRHDGRDYRWSPPLAYLLPCGWSCLSRSPGRVEGSYPAPHPELAYARRLSR